MSGLDLRDREKPITGNYIVSDNWCLRRHDPVGSRQMRGEELQGLSAEELQLLEKSLESGLNLVMEKKGEKIMNEIWVLQQKGNELMEENERLRQQVQEVCKGRLYVGADYENVVYEEGQSSESDTDGCSSGSPPQDYDDSSDTSLKLGLPYSGKMKRSYSGARKNV